MESYKKVIATFLVVVFMFTCTYSALASNGDNGAATDTSANPLVLETEGLDEIQLNSMNMLNYLVVLTQEINASPNNRLYLEEVYSNLLNNISPEAIDDLTLDKISDLLDALEGYRMIAVKRERLRYIYEQNKADAFWSLVPEPLNVLSFVEADDNFKRILTVAQTAFNSYASYQSAGSNAELQYLEGGWDLDDEEAARLHEIRKGTFNYMVKTVQEYKLPGNLSLTEQAVANYVEWKNKTNVHQVIQFFEENQKTYQGYGPYWLTMAEFYYKNKDYVKCLQAIGQYQDMQNNIFRRDYSYARALPFAIDSAKELYNEKEYINAAKGYLSDIIKNSGNENWVLRYFAAQVYVELFGLTDEVGYLQAAYDIALNNVNYLLDEQKALNTQYLSEIQEVKAPADANKTEKNDVKQYNKLIKEERKMALPEVYEPLLLNCDLLFFLADELKIPEEEAKRIDAILHENGAALFLIESLDAMYWMGEIERLVTTNDGDAIMFDGKRINLAVQYITNKALIKVTVISEGEETIFDDWVIEKVERKNEKNLGSFTANYTNADIKNYKFKAGDQIRIEVIPRPDKIEEPIVSLFEAVPSKKLYVLDSFDFQRVNE